jgi:hypothetical protein
MSKEWKSHSRTSSKDAKDSCGRRQVRSKKEEEEEEKEKDLTLPTNEGTLAPAKTGLRLVPSLTWTVPNPNPCSEPDDWLSHIAGDTEIRMQRKG